MGGRRLATLVAAVLASSLGGLTVGAPRAAAASPPALAELAYEHGGSIYSLRADGSGRRELLASPGRGASIHEPVWSPDGRALAFTKTVRTGEDENEDDRSQILIVEGGRQRALTPLRKDVQDGSPAWSPDGTRVAFARFTTHGEDLASSIAVVGANGSAPRTVVSQELDPNLRSVSEPAWLPDGRTLAFTKSIFHQTYFDSSVYRIRDDGQQRRRVLRHAGSAQWSRDGSAIAYGSIQDHNGDQCGSDECSYNGEVYVARGDGTQPRRLTVNKGDDQRPRFSPDGQRILFSSDRNYPEGDGREVYSVARDGSCLTWLTNGAPASGSPAWRTGTGARTDPGRCAGAGRRPLVETRVGKRARGAFWLGTVFRGLLLSDYGGSGGTGYFGYSDCGRFDPRSCPGEVSVQTKSTCARYPFESVLSGGSPVRRRRGTLVSYPENEAFELYTGASQVRADFSAVGSRRVKRARLAVFRGLMRFGRKGTLGAEFAPRGSRPGWPAGCGARSEPGAGSAASGPRPGRCTRRAPSCGAACGWPAGWIAWAVSTRSGVRAGSRAKGGARPTIAGAVPERWPSG